MTGLAGRGGHGGGLKGRAARAAPALDWMREGDLDAVARIHAVSFDDAWNARMIGKILAMPRSSGMVARDGVGGLVIGFTLSRIAGDECELLSIAVDPGHRGGGLGAKLLDAALGLAASLDAKKFFLEVAEDNLPARKLYATRGLVPVGRRPHYYRLKSGETADALTMRRDLTPGLAANAPI